MVVKEKNIVTGIEYSLKPSTSGSLYLIPTPIGPPTTFEYPIINREVGRIKYFFAEDLRSARRFISGLGLGITIESLHIELINKNTDSKAISLLMQNIPHEEDVGYVSEAGCPGIADPGALLVKWFHLHSRRVKPLVGPSSIFLALIASGLNGQQFSFHGYLPIDKKEKKEALLKLEKQSRSLNQTQIFIETPYRNEVLLEAFLEYLSPETLLCVASGLQMPEESIKTLRIKQWKNLFYDLAKIPTVFLMLAS